MKTEEKSLVEGPWYVGSQNDGLCIINEKPSPAGTDVVWEGRKSLRHIACMDLIENSFEEASKAANLLAAAPTLLEAVQLALKHLQATGSGKGFLRQKLEDAVRKAEGK